MAKKQGKVYLGYEDDCVNEKNQTLLNYTVNKIGGYPNWPPIEPVPQCPKCPLCGLHRLLVVQCYAPLENSIYSRTLYLFSCINPNCWIQSESWICLRSQIQEASLGSGNAQATVLIPSSETPTAWCNGADDWDDNDNVDRTNGNVMDEEEYQNQNDVIPRVSDEDEESNSLEVETVEQALGNLQMYDAHNANMSPVQGAVGALRGPSAAAELEGGDEPGLVSVDSPTVPTADLEALLHQAAELPLEMRSRLTYGPLQFTSKFVYVEEEVLKSRAKCADDRVMEMLNIYKRDHDIDGGEIKAGGGGGGAGLMDDEQYEEAVPLHGDKLFHAFLTRLKENPEQILRYSREEPPLLGAPLPPDSLDQSAPTTCIRCGGRLICELQLLPAFAEALRVFPGQIQLGHLHFLSVLVFTCAQSCWNATDTVFKETVVFQPEI